ncbi:MAG: putative membrane protein [Paraglaciecola sp.]|jgi:putative membrane protein
MMQEQNLQLAKKLNIAAWIVSAVVLALVVAMRKISLDFGIDFTFLPPLYSILNALTAVFLMSGLYQIKQKNIANHQRLMNVAVILSALFLLCYVLYHITTPETKYGDVNYDGVVDEAELLELGGMRTVYLILLITHIVLAAVILPFILFTYIRAYTNQIVKHRKMARWVFPFWLYVAVTGPILYLMLMPYYK